MASSPSATSTISSLSQSDSLDRDIPIRSPDQHPVFHSPPTTLKSMAWQKDESSNQASVSFSKHLPTPVRPATVIHSAAASSRSATPLARSTIPDHKTKPLAKPPETTTGKPMSKSKLPPQSPPCLSKPNHSIDAKSVQAGKPSSEEVAPATPTSPMRHPFLSTNAPLPSLPPTPRPLHPFHRHTSISGLLHSNTPATSNASSDTLWQAFCVRVLPLFNGEGVQGAVEDMNDLLR